MRSKLALLIVGLALATGASLTACSSGDSIPDDGPTEPPEYQSLQDDEDSESEPPAVAQEEGDQPGQAPPTGQPQQPEGQGEIPEATGPVATVDGEEISAEEFNDQIEQIQAQNPQLPPAYIAQESNEIINQLVEQKLLYDAVEEADFEVTDEMVEERLEEFRQEFRETSQSQFGEEMEFEDFVAQMGMDEEELYEVIEETVAIEMLLQEHGMETPTDEDVRAFYEENQEVFTEPESMEARHILIMPETDDDEAWEQAQQEAQEIHQELTEGDADFAEVAAERSDDVASAEQGGDIGSIVRDQPIDPDFIEAAFALDEGEVSEPVRTEHGWHIIEVVEYDEGGVADFEEVEPQLERELEAQAMEESLQGYLAELRENVEIELHPENIE